MNKRATGAGRLAVITDALRCPVCGSSVSVDEHPSLVCTNRHSFDIAKQGYVNMLSRSPAASYSKELFLARRRIITESALYTPLHQTMAELLTSLFDGRAGLAADIGCGEGSHLNELRKICGPSLKAAGLDIAKEGVRLAARDYPDCAWIVGDLAASPFADRQTTAILNILSPSNYSEFRRMLAPGGKLIKVIPAAGYLKELREAAHGEDGRSEYSNEETVGLFSRHFRLEETIPLRYQAEIAQDMLKDLVTMTPLGWTGDRNKIEQFLDREEPVITIELDVLIGTAEMQDF
ncbi:putative RNA methyltransferase [Edaphobacillus lindanitolerans]|uniref:23S rRNA m(1)G-748 methyltransferase n=1 Tax=Edaphobacillus lindanitolerans TaxID=550447 RepID=A0A1U7PKC8_9BACI|nr:methyltransferase domain-containing protein [Edaphobacillus lindanitolerans]SIT71537.1 23S rRNA m(1)G-748 methyltransferase [Edaphobacillus lindanitolerans]